MFPSTLYQPLIPGAAIWESGIAISVPLIRLIVADCFISTLEASRWRLPQSDQSHYPSDVTPLQFQSPVETRRFVPPIKPLDAPRFCFPIAVLIVWSFLGCGYILAAQQLGDCLPTGA